MKRLFCFSVGMLFLLGAVSLWASGSKESPAPQGATESAAGKGASYIADVSLTYWAPFSERTATTRQTYNEVPTYQEAIKMTGVKIRYISPPLGQDNQQFNLLLASGDLPDIVYWNWLNIPGGPEKAISDGVILKLNDLASKDAPSLSGFLGKRPDIAREVVTDNGTLYEVPFLRTWIKDKSEIWERYFNTPQLRGDWLKEMNLQPPKTIDEWEKVLTAFKGRGADVIPYADLPYAPDGIIQGFRWFMGAWKMNYDFYVVDGKIHYGSAEPAYKDYLTVMNRWYSKGLIDQDFVSRTYNQVRSLVLDNKVGSYWGRLNSEMGGFSGLAAKGGNKAFVLVAAPWPYADDGKSYQMDQSHASAFQGTGAAITSKNKYPDVSMKWLDFWWSNAGHMLANFGIEGQTYTMVNGFPQYTDLIMKNPEGLSPVLALSKYAPDGSGGRFWIQDARYWQQMMDLPAQTEAGKMLASTGDTSRVIPPITPTSDESRELAGLLNQINTYRDEMLVKFIVGQAPLSQFDDYLAQMKKMGIDRAIAIEQSAYDRYVNRPIPKF